MTITVNWFLYFERNRAIFTFILVCKNMQIGLTNGSTQVKLLVINLSPGLSHGRMREPTPETDLQRGDIT